MKLFNNFNSVYANNISPSFSTIPTLKLVRKMLRILIKTMLIFQVTTEANMSFSDSFSKVCVFKQAPSLNIFDTRANPALCYTNNLFALHLNDGSSIF